MSPRKPLCCRCGEVDAGRRDRGLAVALCAALLLAMPARGDRPRSIEEVTTVSVRGQHEKGQPGADDHVYIGIYRHPKGGVDNWPRIQQVFDEEICEYVTIPLFGLPPDQRVEIVRRLVRDRRPFMLLGQYPGWTTLTGKPEQYTTHEVAAWREMAGDLLLGISSGEMDSSGLNPIWDGQRMRWVDAPTMQRLEEEGKYAPPGPDRTSRRALREGWARKLRELPQPWRRETGVKIAHHCGVLWHAAAAEAGVDIIGSEIGENIPTVSMMLASNRGAARSYGLPILADMSPWFVGETPPKAGHTAYFCTVCYLDALFGGAKYIQYEVDWSAWDEAGHLTPWGEGLRSFYRLYRHIGRPGETVTPLAILVGRDHGWPGVGWQKGDVRATGLWDGIHGRALPVSSRDWSLKYLDVFFPGFELCGHAPEYPGFLTRSPHGQLDWITDDQPADFLSRYRAVFCLGYHAATPEILENLLNYVQDGGVVFLGDDMLLTEKGDLLDSPSVERLVGAKIGRDTYEARHAVASEAGHDILPGGKVDEHDAVVVRAVQPTTARVIATISHRPLILENRVGKGRCFFATAAHLVGCSQEAPAPFREPTLMLDSIRAATSAIARKYGDGVRVEPAGDIEYYLCEKTPGTHWLLLMNHGHGAWRGTVSLDGAGVKFRVAAIGHATDWREPAPDTAKEQGGTLELELPAEHYAIIQVTGTLACCSRHA